MASIYDEIKTAKELVEMVAIRGMSTNIDDICRAQDIFGNSTVQELDALANDNGRNDSDGNPDPNGTWSSGRQGTQKTFYSILFHIWSWEDATRFYNQHTNPEFKELKGLRKENREAAKRVEELERDRKELQEEIDLLKKKLNEAEDKMCDITIRADKAEDEVIQLKAKLYDLMVR